ncbi:MAG TPA: OmpA family protein [Nitrospira sp.]|nr:OmpA family protein [Nitrospira sp.]
MRRRTIVGGGAFALTLLALVCIPRHLPSSVLPAPLVPANFHARLEQNQLTLRGSLPNAATRDRILQQAHTLYDRSQIRIVDELTVDQQIAPAPWMTPLPSLLPLLGQMNGRGSVIIDGHSLVLTGRVPSEQAKGTILRTVAPVTSLGLELEDHILAGAPTAAHLSLQAKINEILSRNRIEFDSNQSTLTPRGRAVLDQLIPLLQRAPRTTIEIGGHTDGFGAPAYNMELSRRRAESVRDYLVKRGLPHRFTAVGYGASKPRSTEVTQNALRRNRRIELLVQEQGDL